MADLILPIMAFQSVQNLHDWLLENHAVSVGIWVRLYKKSSGVDSVAFLDLLDEGLCFGWSESARRAYDDQSYLQKITPPPFAWDAIGAQPQTGGRPDPHRTDDPGRPGCARTPGVKI